MTFEEANDRIKYENSYYYGYELDRELYETEEEYKKALEEDEAKSKEAHDFFGITTEESICEHCYYRNVCGMEESINGRRAEIVASCKQCVSDEIPDPREDEYTKDWTYEDWSKGR